MNNQTNNTNTTTATANTATTDVEYYGGIKFGFGEYFYLFV